MNGHESCVRALVSGGCDIHIRDIRGKTALDWAMEKNHSGCAGILRGDNVLSLASDIDKEKKDTDVDVVIQAAVSNSLTDFLDTYCFNAAALSKALLTKPIISSLENVLQVIPFFIIVTIVTNCLVIY